MRAARVYRVTDGEYLSSRNKALLRDMLIHEDTSCTCQQTDHYNFHSALIKIGIFYLGMNILGLKWRLATAFLCSALSSLSSAPTSPTRAAYARIAISMNATQRERERERERERALSHSWMEIENCCREND